MNSTFMQKFNVDEKEQAITFSCASETPYLKLINKKPCYEVLLLDAKNVDLSRLEDGASLLFEHDSKEILGVVEKVWIAEKMLFVRVRFRKNDEKAVNIYKDILDGTIKNVSLQYFVYGYEFKEDTKNKIKTAYAISWQPVEVSIVGIPADSTVGIRKLEEIKEMAKRSLTEEEKTKLEDLKKQVAELEAVEKEEVKTEAKAEAEPAKEEVIEEGKPEATAKPEVTEAVATTAEPAKEEVKEEEKEVKSEAEEEKTDDKKSKEVEAEIKSIAKTFNCEELGEKALKRNASVNEFKNEVKEAKKNLNIITKGDKKMSEKRSIDKGIVDLMARSVKMGQNAGFTYSSRAGEFVGTTSGNGAGLVQTVFDGTMFVDNLKLKMACTPRYINPQGVYTFPVKTASTQASWISSINGAAGKTAPTVSNITLAPKALTAYVEVSRDLLTLADPEATSMVIADLENAIATELDKTILMGNATAQIKGIKGTTGVQTVTFDGTAGTFANVVSMKGKVGKYAGLENAKYIFSAEDESYFETKATDAGSGIFVAQNNKIAGRAYSVCGSLSQGDIFYGDFSNVYLAQWGGIEILVNPFALDISGGVRITATLKADIGVVTPAGFVIRVDAEESDSSSSSAS